MCHEHETDRPDNCDVYYTRLPSTRYIGYTVVVSDTTGPYEIYVDTCEREDFMPEMEELHKHYDLTLFDVTKQASCLADVSL